MYYPKQNVIDDMNKVAELLLNKKPEISHEISGKNGFDYECSIYMKEVHFLTNETLKEKMDEARLEHAEKVCIKISENVFKNHCRYILLVDKMINTNQKVIHYDYTNCNLMEVCQKIQENQIIKELTEMHKLEEVKEISQILEKDKIFGVKDKQEVIEIKKKLFGMSIIDYEKQDQRRLKKLFDYMGYSEEHINKILKGTDDYTEPVRLYITVAMRFLFDDNPDINLTGRKIISHLFGRELL